MRFAHKPVMLTDCIDALRIKPEGVYVDGTLGGGGHAREICARLSEAGTLVGIDRDMHAIDAAAQALAPFSERAILVRGNFHNVAQILFALKIEAVDGFLLDLGVSSHQLDTPDRGFSYKHDAPLDMRMDTTQKLSAYEVVNRYSEKKLGSLIGEYGEERFAKRIAKFIVSARQETPITTTAELVEIIRQAMPKSAPKEDQHPAKRTFQAIRIAVNEELEKLGEAIMEMTERLKVGGRICAISFHSLEDRIVKTVFKKLENPCVCPPDLPMCACGKQPTIKIITKKPLVADAAEVMFNPRARSAKLRVAEKI